MSSFKTQNRKYIPSFCIIALLLCLLSFSNARGAVSPPAVAVEVSGPAHFITEEGQYKTLSKGRFLEDGQAIATGAGGRVKLKLRDGSSVEIFEKARLEVNELVTEEEDKNETSLALILGHIEMKIKKLFAPEIVVTPTMIAGVRGTEFSVSVAEDGSSIVSVDQGKVSVSSGDEPDAEKGVLLSADQEARADAIGQRLRAQKRQIRSFKDAKAFRKKRLEQFIPMLPKAVGKLENGIDKRVSRMEYISAAIDRKAQKIDALIKEAKSLKPRERKKLKKIKMQLKPEIQGLFKNAKAFKIQGMRLKALYSRTVGLNRILPDIKDKLGDNYQLVEGKLENILNNRHDVKQRIVILAADVRKNVARVRPLVKRMKARGN